MGIRFYCPKGHKLNVKRFQAGRTGVCPRCGATMHIPLESTRRSSKVPPSAAVLGSETISPQPLVTPIYTHHPAHHAPPHAPPRRTQLVVIGALLSVLLLLLTILLLIASRQ
jgi:hypothetical protein